MTLQDFKNKYLGKQVEYHSYGSGAKNQCIDLVNQYIVEVLGLTPIIGTNAKDVKDRYNKEEFDWIANTPEAIIEAGDIPVWNGNVGGNAGHIAIALAKGTLTSFTSLDQNWSQKERVTVETHNYSNVTGWLRPKGGDSNMTDELKACLDQHKDLVDQIEKELKPKITDLEQTIDEKKGTIRAFEDFRNQLSNKLAVENQTTAILGTIERLLTVESDFDRVSAENKDLKEQLEGIGSADERVRELVEANNELIKANTALSSEVELLKKKKMIDRFTTSELISELINRLLRKN